MMNNTPTNNQHSGAFYYPNQPMLPGQMRVIQPEPASGGNNPETEGRERVGSGSDSGNGSDEITPNGDAKVIKKWKWKFNFKLGLIILKVCATLLILSSLTVNLSNT